MRFEYRARTQGGDIQHGFVDASSEETALETLRQYGLIVLGINPERALSLGKEITIFSRVKRREIVIFSRQLSVLIDAQVPLLEALKTLAEQAETAKFRKIILEVVEDIDAGMQLSQALSKYPDLFSEFYRSVTAAGEASGRLQEVLNYLADHEEKSYDLNRKVRGAMVYPAFVIFSIVLVGAIMMIFVVPQLTAVLTESNVELPILTRIVIAISNFLVEFWWLALIAFAGLVAGGIFYVRTPNGKAVWDTFLLNIPTIKVLFRKIYLTRMSENLSTLIKGGIPIIEALQITGAVVGNTVYKETILEAAEVVKTGGTISSVFKENKYIPIMVSQMITVGEDTGRTDVILEKIGTFYQKDVDNLVDNLTSLIQPILILVLGAAAGVLVAAILLPIYNLSSGL